MGGLDWGVGFPACVTESLSEECLLFLVRKPSMQPQLFPEQTGPRAPAWVGGPHRDSSLQGLKLPPGGLG